MGLAAREAQQAGTRSQEQYYPDNNQSYGSYYDDGYSTTNTHDPAYPTIRIADLGNLPEENPSYRDGYDGYSGTNVREYDPEHPTISLEDYAKLLKENPSHRDESYTASGSGTTGSSRYWSDVEPEVEESPRHRGEST